jgi:hypothetical protein
MKRDDLVNLLVIRNLENPELRNGAINARHPEDLFVQLIERQFVNMFRLTKEVFTLYLHQALHLNKILAIDCQLCSKIFWV